MALRFPASVERGVARSFLALPPPVLRRIVGPVRHSPDGLELDLQLQGLLWLIARLKVPPLHTGGAARARISFDHSGPTLGLLPPPNVATYDRTIPGADDDRRARIYTPERARATKAPGLVFFHGGGFVLGSIESHDTFCRSLAGKSGAVVVSVEYRLAPEHPFPAGPKDAIAATRWVLDHAAQLGIDPTRVAVGGDSAGANLSAVAALALRDEPRRPAFQLLVYPGTDLTRAMPSHAMFADSFFLSRAAGDWYLGQYLQHQGDAKNPMASPLFAPDVSRLPPALVIVAGFDPLRDEGRAYAERMREAGVEVELFSSDGQMHGFIMLGGALREAARVVDLIADRLMGALAPRA